MFPHPQALRILIQIRKQPIRTLHQPLTPHWVARSPQQVVISQPPLRNCNRVVLQTNPSVVIQHRNTVRVVMPRIIRLRRERHVIFAKLISPQITIDFRPLMPKRQLALARQQIRTKDSPVVLQSIAQIPTRHSEASMSYPSTAIVVNARIFVELLPVGRNALPYWKSLNDHRSLFHDCKPSHAEPLELP